MSQWAFYDSGGTLVSEHSAQFKARMTLVSSDIAAGAHFLFEEIQPIDGPTMIWQCRSLTDLKGGIAHYVANGHWPTKH